MSREQEEVTIRFTKEELWELMNNFDASYIDGTEGNELASSISSKLDKAYKKFDNGRTAP